MRFKRAKSRFLSISMAVTVFLLLSACNKPDTPKRVATEFWEAVQQKNMEKAKNLSSWDTVDYLKYLQAEKIHPERFELGEVVVSEANAEVDTVLYSSKQGETGIKIPGKTLLVKTEQGWRVNVKSTLGSVVRHTVDNVFEQLNGMMREGVKELDKALSESIQDIGEALEESANELKKELSRPSFSTPPPSRKVPEEPAGRQI